ncbi:MMPL family transporter [Streptomyces sp. NPDC006283]|uniref:MMPL family transporter n=1 Tax=Streptomyces sp. NPDC006283 TaxID=3156741 RepID=UPI0033A4F1A3
MSLPHSSPAASPPPSGSPPPAAAPPPSGRRPGALYRTGRWCALRPRRVVAAWLLLLAAALGLAHAFGGEYSDEFPLPGTQVQTGSDLLKVHASGPGKGTQSPIVLHTANGTVADHGPQLDATVSALGKLPHVLGAADPYSPSASAGALSADGRTALVQLSLDANPATYGGDWLNQVDRAVQNLRDDGVLVEYGGQLGQAVKGTGADRLPELIGLATAVVVLLVGFGSVAAAGVPLVAAVAGLGVGLLGLEVAAAHVDFATTAPTLASMIGLGVGLDYALFLTTRHRRLLRDTGDVGEAAGRAVSTSGRAVLVAAGTVAVALAGLAASGISFLGALGAAACVTVVAAALASLTLTPALLGWFGPHIDRRHIRRPVDEPDGGQDFWYRWAAGIRRRPVLALAGGLMLLGVLAVPALSMRTAHIDAGAAATDTTARRAHDLVSDAFGPGVNGPLTLVVTLDKDHPVPDASRSRIAGDLQTAIAADPRVASVATPAATADRALLTTAIVPRTGPQEQDTADLVHDLTDSILPRTLDPVGARGYLTGPTVGQITFRDLLADRLPLVVGVVAAAAFVLLVLVFRTPVLALKAAVLNLLSIGAAWGVLVAVFQWGWGSSLFGVDEHVPIESYVPALMFAIVFGLSMDYEIFLLSRVRELWRAGASTHDSVAGGLAATARVITCAALVMTSVFLAFLLNDNIVVKMLALGLALSIVLDATVVRLILVPAAMYVLGRVNWWLPKWLDRLLPHVDAEGSAPVAHSTGHGTGAAEEHAGAGIRGPEKNGGR